MPATAEEDAFIDGRRADQDCLGLEDLRNDVIFVGTGAIEQLDGDLVVGLPDPCGNRLRHFARTVPHGVIDDGYLVFLIIIGPFQIFIDDLQRVFPPDDAVARADHIHRHIQSHDLFYFLVHQPAEGRQDICIVLEAFLIQFRLVDQVVEHQFRGIMLAEGVVAEKDIVPVR